LDSRKKLGISMKKFASELKDYLKVEKLENVKIDAKKLMENRKISGEG
jgi:hypothetical protein